MKVKEYGAGELKRLPDWVKCMTCGGKPTEHDWLIDIIACEIGQSSNALIHMSCAAGKGKFAGLNIGTQGANK